MYKEAARTGTQCGCRPRSRLHQTCGVPSVCPAAPLQEKSTIATILWSTEYQSDPISHPTGTLGRERSRRLVVRANGPRITRERQGWRGAVNVIAKLVGCVRWLGRSDLLAIRVDLAPHQMLEFDVRGLHPRVPGTHHLPIARLPRHERIKLDKSRLC